MDAKQIVRRGGKAASRRNQLFSQSRREAARGRGAEPDACAGTHELLDPVVLTDPKRRDDAHHRLMCPKARFGTRHRGDPTAANPTNHPEGARGGRNGRLAPKFRTWRRMDRRETLVTDSTRDVARPIPRLLG